MSALLDGRIKKYDVEWFARKNVLKDDGKLMRRIVVDNSPVIFRIFVYFAESLS